MCGPCDSPASKKLGGLGLLTQSKASQQPDVVLKIKMQMPFQELVARPADSQPPTGQPFVPWLMQYQRKLLMFFFDADFSGGLLNKVQSTGYRLSQQKLKELGSSRLFVSEEIHSYLSKKHKELNQLVYSLEEAWTKRNYPHFYCYYFLKFSFSNDSPTMLSLVKRELSDLHLNQDHFSLISKALQAREACLGRFVRGCLGISVEDVYQFMAYLNEKHQNVKRFEEEGYKILNSRGVDKPKWLQFSESLTHLRKLTTFLVEKVSLWKESTIRMTTDPRRYRQRVIFYYQDQNYLLKLLEDMQFLKNTVLNNFIDCSRNDPFLLHPLWTKSRPESDHLLESLKPENDEALRVIAALRVIGQQLYDQMKYLQSQNKFRIRTAQRSLEEAKALRESQLYRDRIKVDTHNLEKTYKKEILRRESPAKKAVKSLYHRNQYGKPISKAEQEAKPWNQMFNQLVVDNQTKLDQIHLQYYLNRKANSHGKIALPLSKNIADQRVRPRIISTKEGTSINSRDMDQVIKFNQQKASRQEQSSTGQMFDFLEKKYKDRQNQQGKKRVAELQALLSDSEAASKERLLLSIESVTARKEPVLESKIRALAESRKVTSTNIQNLKKQIYEQMKQDLFKEFRKSRQQFPPSQQAGQLADSPKKAQTKKQQSGQPTDSPKKTQTKKQQTQAKALKVDSPQKNGKLQKIQSPIQETIQISQMHQLPSQQEKESQPPSVLQFTPKRLTQAELLSFLALEFANFKDQMLPLFSQNPEKLSSLILKSHYPMILEGRVESLPTGVVVLHLQESNREERLLRIDFLMTYEEGFMLKCLESVLQYLWRQDPCLQIQLKIELHSSNASLKNLSDRIHAYSEKHALAFPGHNYQGSQEMLYIFKRPARTLHYLSNLPLKANRYSSRLLVREQILACQHPLNEQLKKPTVLLSLQSRVSYAMHLSEMFRHYLTPQQIIILRENTNDISKLKDMFNLVVSLDKNKAKLPEITCHEQNSLRQFTQKMALLNADRRLIFPFVDTVTPNKTLYSSLQYQLKFDYPIFSSQLEGQPYMRVHVDGLVNTMTSSISGHQPIYMLSNSQNSHRVFVMSGVNFKGSRLELFIYLKLLFSNIVYQNARPISNIWIPQFACNSPDQEAVQLKKQIYRITDFSIALKRNMWLSEDHYFASKQYLPAAVEYSLLGSDVSLRSPFIVGVFSKQVDQSLAFLPIWARLISDADLCK